jgi:hypothetical protein
MARRFPGGCFVFDPQADFPLPRVSVCHGSTQLFLILPPEQAK